MKIVACARVRNAPFTKGRPVLLHDTLFVVAQSRMQDRYRDAALRALLADAERSVTVRSTLAVHIGHLFVWLGERIEGVRYAPVTTLSSGHSSH